MIFVTESDISELNDILPVITYIGGYCAHSVIKKLNCVSCKENLILDNDLPDSKFSLTVALDRGGLKYPCDEIITIVIFNYIVVQKLLSPGTEKQFLSVQDHKHIACKLSEHILYSSENYTPCNDCVNGHTFDTVLKLILATVTNIFLKNYCKKINNY